MPQSRLFIARGIVGLLVVSIVLLDVVITVVVVADVVVIIVAVLVVVPEGWHTSSWDSEVPDPPGTCPNLFRAAPL